MIAMIPGRCPVCLWRLDQAAKLCADRICTPCRTRQELRSLRPVPRISSSSDDLNLQEARSA